MMALGVSDGPRAVDPLLAKLADPAAQVRQVAVYALSYSRDPRVVDPLLTEMKCLSFGASESVLHALQPLHDPRVTALIEAEVTGAIDNLQSLNIDCSASAAETLSTLGGPRAVDALLAALRSDRPYVRGNAAFALGMMLEPRAIAPLIAALADPDHYVPNGQAGDALTTITGQHFGQDAARWETWRQVQVQ
jgi:HEAT repeat protein